MIKTAIITGSGSGLGEKLVKLFAASPEWSVLPVDKDLVDLRSPEEIRKFCNRVNLPYLSLLVNCAGINRISWLEQLTVLDWMEVMGVNALAPVLLTQGLLPLLIAGKGTVCNVVSNASHVPMTASLVYNASKAALHMITLQLARELTKKYELTVLGISPNKLSRTGMSQYIDSRVPEIRGWSAEEARKYQLNALPTGRETDPAAVAEFMYWLLSEKSRHVFLSGCVIPYGG